MALARHGRGPLADLGAAASQVHPVFMLPPVAVATFGGLVAARGSGTFAPLAWSLHVVAIFFAVYTAHVKDGYVDFHRRGEDDDHPVTEDGCRVLLGASSLAFFLGLAGVWAVGGTLAAGLTLPTWCIAILHAPQLDTTPIGATLGYPSGVALALLGGYVVQTGRVDPIATAFALVFLLLLAGVKVIDDAQDVAYDRSIAKRTVPVALGTRLARRTAYGLMAAALVAVVVASLRGPFPVAAILAPAVFAPLAALTRRAGPELSTQLLVRSCYLFLAVLVAAVWFQPMA